MTDREEKGREDGQSAVTENGAEPGYISPAVKVRPATNLNLGCVAEDDREESRRCEDSDDAAGEGSEGEFGSRATMAPRPSRKRRDIIPDFVPGKRGVALPTNDPTVGIWLSTGSACDAAALVDVHCRE